MAVTRFRNSGLTVGNTKYDSMLGGYPGLMAAPTATAGTESASVAFTARSGISTYRVISTPGSITATGTSSPISVTGLTGGTAYTFQIRGENAVGNGAYSAASNSVTPTLNTSFESLATVTSNGSNSVLTFSSIPSTYRHLQIRGIGRHSAAVTGSEGYFIRFNSDSGANYARHRIWGTGSSVSSDGATGRIWVEVFNGLVYNSASSNTFGASIVDIEDYASTSKNKTVRAFSGADGNSNDDFRVNISSGVWLNTNAISSISVHTGGTDAFVSGSTFALYGIKG